MVTIVIKIVIFPTIFGIIAYSLIGCSGSYAKEYQKKNNYILKIKPRYCDLNTNVQLLDLVNRVRMDKGLNLLVPNQDLAMVSKERVRQIALQSTLSHRGWRNILSKTGKKWQSAGENLAFGYQNPEAVVKGWLKSRAHRRIILRDHFKYTAVGCFIDSNQVHWWTQHFAGELLDG